ncbi:hypothetical protein JM949_06790 [Micromonospora sp. STR1s_6]|uniref:Uncharacterized protein n=1 Tax=Micromonospora tarensis TaxID=2806100 RepID=A0ABS1YCQ1_9ACTN|nr:hypothetical protein [Micromonospora tarensis]MBM0275181.1 hypothetical protein [Micromonospora tarensis]
MSVEHVRGRLPPRGAAGDLGEQLGGTLAVAAAGFARPLAGEFVGKLVLVHDAPASGQMVGQDESAGGVVGESHQLGRAVHPVVDLGRIRRFTALEGCAQGVAAGRQHHGPAYPV